MSARNVPGMTLRGVIFSLSAGLGVSALAGTLYAFLITWNTFVYINIGATCAFGWLIGCTVTWAGNLGRMQSSRAFTALAICCAAVGLYVSWVVWFFIISRHQFIILHPGDLWQCQKIILQEGTWRLNGHALKGLALLLMWVGEAGIVIGLAQRGARDVMKHCLVCDTCQHWFSKPTHTRHYAIAAAPQLQELLQNHEYEKLANFAAVDIDPLDAYSQLNIYLCPDCGSSATCHLKTTRFHRQGEELRIERQDLGEFLTPKIHVGELKSQLLRPAAPAPAAPDPAPVPTQG